MTLATSCLGPWSYKSTRRHQHKNRSAKTTEYPARKDHAAEAQMPSSLGVIVTLNLLKRVLDEAFHVP